MKNSFTFMINYIQINNKMTDRFNIITCSVCARTAAGYGYMPKNKNKALWVCNDPECLKLAKDSYNMRQNDFTRVESIAAANARFDAGDYMKKIGQFDLSKMSEEQAIELCRRIVAGYRKSLKELISNECPF